LAVEYTKVLKYDSVHGLTTSFVIAFTPCAVAYLFCHCR